MVLSQFQKPFSPTDIRFVDWKRRELLVQQNFRVNETIRVPEVRLIGPKNENIGVVPIEEALQIAREAELDLVEVAPGAASRRFAG